MAVEYMQGAELPDVAFTWTDEETGLLDFSTGWSFTVRVGISGSPALIEKTVGISGAATAPNVIIAWEPDELDVLAVGTYDVDVIARNDGTSKDRKATFPLLMSSAVAAP